MLYIVGASLYLALRQSAQSGTPFIPNWASTLIIYAGLGVLMLFSRTLMVVFGLAGLGYLLQDSLGYALSGAGAAFWFLGSVTAFLVTLSIMSGYVAPPINQDFTSSSFMNFRLLLSYAVRELTRPKPFVVLPKDLPSSFETIGAGRLDSHQAVTVHKGTNYVGSMGPGYVMLAENHRISDLIDLRDRMTSERVYANTRDIVNIGADVTVMYSVRRPESSGNSRAPYTYLKESLRDIHYANITYQREHKIRAFQRIGARAALLAEEQIAKRPFNDIYRVTERNHQPLAKVAQEVKDKLALEFKPHGIKILSVSFGDLTLPEEISNTRMKQWQANWNTSINSGKVGGGIRAIDPESAEIQGKVVKDLLANVRTMADASGMPAAHVERLENIIYDIATEGFVRALVPESKNKK